MFGLGKDLDRNWMFVDDVSRAVGRSKYPGVPVLLGGLNLPPLVEIGLTDLPKSGSAMVPPAILGTTGLVFLVLSFKFLLIPPSMLRDNLSF